MRRTGATLLALALAWPWPAALAAPPPAAAPGEPRPAPGATVELGPSPGAARLRAGMERWHRHYRGRILPLLDAWRGVRRAARAPWAAESLETGCRRMEAELAALQRRRLPLAPDRSVSIHLQETLLTLAGAAGSCTRGAFFLTEWRLRQADESWARLARRLGLYGLAP